MASRVPSSSSMTTFLHAPNHVANRSHGGLRVMTGKLLECPTLKALAENAGKVPADQLDRDEIGPPGKSGGPYASVSFSH
jgi:hypothetical protein